MVMDKYGNIYEMDEAAREAARQELAAESEIAAKFREDVARLDGYLKARAEADAPKRERPNSDLTNRS